VNSNPQAEGPLGEAGFTGSLEEFSFRVLQKYYPQRLEWIALQLLAGKSPEDLHNLANAMTDPASAVIIASTARFILTGKADILHRVDSLGPACEACLSGHHDELCMKQTPSGERCACACNTGGGDARKK
jgi:hypothetical protein